MGPPNSWTAGHKWGGLETTNLWLTSEVTAVLWITDLLTCGICANSGWLVPELNCMTLVGVGMPILNLTVAPFSRVHKTRGSQQKLDLKYRYWQSLL